MKFIRIYFFLSLLIFCIQINCHRKSAENTLKRKNRRLEHDHSEGESSCSSTSEHEKSSYYGPQDFPIVGADLNNAENEEEHKNFKAKIAEIQHLIDMISSQQPDSTGNTCLEENVISSVKEELGYLQIIYENELNGSMAKSNDGNGWSFEESDEYDDENYRKSKRRHRRHKNSRSRKNMMVPINKDVMINDKPLLEKKERRSLRIHRHANKVLVSRRNQQLTYAGTAARYKTIPDLLVVITAISTTYTQLFDPVANAQAAEAGGLSQVMMYTRYYAIIRNFVIAFSEKKKQILNDIKTLLDENKTIGFTRDEVIDFYGMRVAYEGVRVSPKSFDSAFLAQDMELTRNCNQLNPLLNDLKNQLNILYGLNDEVQKIIETVDVAGDPNSSQAMQGVMKADALILAVGDLLSTYNVLQGTIISIKTDYNSIIALRSKLQATISNMEVIAYGRKITGDTNSVSVHRTYAALLMVSIYSICL